MSVIRLSLATIAVTFMVTALGGCFLVSGGDDLRVSQAVFLFTNDVPVSTVTIQKPSEGTIEWFLLAADIPPWLDVSILGFVPKDDDALEKGVVLAGTVAADSQVLRMSLNDEAGALQDGTFQDSFTIFSDRGDQLIVTTLRVTTPGRLLITPLELDFGALLAANTLTISNGGSLQLDWSITIDPVGEWLGISEDSPTAGSITTGLEFIEIRVDRTGLEPGHFVGSVDFTSNGGSVSIPIMMEVSEPIPILSVDPDERVFETNGLEEKTIVIRNVGQGTLNWTLVDDLPAWISVDRTSGQTTGEIDRVTLTIDATGLPAGDFTHTVTVTSVDAADGSTDAGTDSVVVRLTVPIPIPILSVAPTEFDLGILGEEDFFRIQNIGTGVLDWELMVDAGSPWLTIAPEDPTSGSLTTETQTIDFNVDRAGLTEGVKTGTIHITSNDGNIDVTVIIEVLPPTLNVVPSILNFGTRVTDKLVAIFNSGAGSVNWSVAAGSFPSWLSIDLASGAVSGSQTDGARVTVNRVGLAPGDFEFAFPVTSNGGTVIVQVLMTVAESPILSIETFLDDGTPAVDAFGQPFVPVGTRNERTFIIRNIGTGTLEWSIDDSAFPGWLAVVGPGIDSKLEGELEPSEGAEITVLVDRTGLAFGGNTFDIFIDSNDIGNRKQRVRIEMTVEKKARIFAGPTPIDLGSTDTTALMSVANSGDDGTELRFSIQSNKTWLFVFPRDGRSIGVSTFPLNGDFVDIRIAIDRSQLDTSGAGIGELEIFATRLANPDDDVCPECPPGTVRDRTIEPRTVIVSATAAELTLESAAARLRSPSLIRYVILMRNLRAGPIFIPDADLDSFSGAFFIEEDNVPLELTETNQFLTSANNLRTDIVILMDYSGSAFDSSLRAQANHLAFGSGTFMDPGDSFLDSLDPLQFIYEKTVGNLIEELPENYNIALMEFHDRNQPGRLITDPNLFPHGFVPNDPNAANGRQVLLDALNNNVVTDHGATELLPALIDAELVLIAQNDPPPTPGPVIPVIPFDDTDVRIVILISDGRLTTPPGDVDDTAQLLAAGRVRLFSVAWGEQLNPGPMAVLSAATGGHFYFTQSLPTGEVVNDFPVVAPSIDTLDDWMRTDFAGDDCDLSIAQDVRSQLVLSYVTLNEQEALVSRVNATFDDPNDGGAALCAIPDQGDISGFIEQDLPVGFFIDQVNLGQVSMLTNGMEALAPKGGGGTREASAIVYVDYMPRDIVELEFDFDVNIAAANGLTTDPVLIALADEIASSMTVTPIVESSATGGIFKAEWQLTGPASGPGVYTVSVPNTDPIQYGLFGRLFQLDFVVPASAPPGFGEFYARLLSIGSTTRGELAGNPLEFRNFTHPDGIPIRTETIFRASSMPTPQITPTLIDFGSSATRRIMTVQNVGGAAPGHSVFLSWFLLGVPIDLDFSQLQGVNISTVEDFPVTSVAIDLNRDRPQTGVITDLNFFLQYDSNISSANGLVSISATGFIEEPILTLRATENGPAVPDNLLTIDLDDDTSMDSFFIENTGQSTLLWFNTDETPDWIALAGPTTIPASEPGEVFVIIFRDILDTLGLSPGDTIAHTFDITATRVDGKTIGFASVTVNVTIGPLPFAADDDFMVLQDSGPTSLDVLANDVASDGNPSSLFVDALFGPDNGGTIDIAVPDADAVIYTPAAGFTGTETFVYRVEDSTGQFFDATVTVTVDPVP